MKIFEMLRLFLLVLVQLIGTISCQTCRMDAPQLRAWIPTNWRTLEDTADYSDLLGSGVSMWTARNADGGGSSFSQFGGLCTRTFHACALTDTVTDNNLVFSPYIRYGAAREVFYNVTTSYLTFCAVCPTYVTAFFYDTNTQSETARTNFANYNLLTGSETSSRFSTSATVKERARPSGINGFYFSLRDTGGCPTILRVILYYRVCIAMVNGLVIFPEVAVPPRSSPNEAYNATCAPNAHPITSMAVDITSSTSVCTQRAPGGAQCACNAGYYRFNATSCEACSPGQYRASNQNPASCNSCPAFTDMAATAAGECACLTGHYRSPQEGSEAPCSQPPGPVRNLRTVSRTDSSITVSWDKPISTGRRSDYYYFVGRSNPQGSATSVVTVNNRLVNLGNTVTFQISNLLPFQSYVITVIVHNGVSSQDSANVGSRTQTTEGQTMASPPGPPVLTPLCSVVVWQPPANPNGVITGYRIRYASGTPSTLPATITYSVTSEAQRTGNAQVQVRAINSAGEGAWSNAVQVCQDACSLPFNVTATSSSLVLTWMRPSSASSDTYTILVSSAGTNTQDSFTHTDSGASLTYPIPSRTPFTAYVITLTNGQSQCTVTASTSEGSPSAPRNFKTYCDVVTWSTPSDVQGELAGYELNIEIGSKQETEVLGPQASSYPTTDDQKKMGAKIRIRASNTNNTGAWTSFYTINSCNGGNSNAGSSSVLGGVGAVDVLIIVIVTAAVCIAIFILIVILAYFCYKCRSKGSNSMKSKDTAYNTSSDVKLNNLY